MRYRHFGAYILTLALVFGCGGTGSGSAADDELALLDGTMISVKTVTITGGSTEEIARRFSGYAHPWDARGVGFLVGGRVASVFVNEGDRVEPGTPIAALDKEDFELVRDLANVQIRAIRPNLERVTKLVASGSLPQMQLDELQARYDAAVTQRRQALRQLSYAELLAPVGGIVMERKTSEGQVIGQGLPVVVLLDVERLKVRFGVTQNDLHAFREGDAAELHFPGMTGARAGRIHHIALVPDVRTRTYDVVVEVDNPDQQLRPGMLAHLNIVAHYLDGIFVPLETIERRNQQEFIVTVVERDPGAAPVSAAGLTWYPGTAVERPVVLGEMVGLQVQVMEGLTEGDELVVRGQRYVRHGDRVRVLVPAPAPVPQGDPS